MKKLWILLAIAPVMLVAQNKPGFVIKGSMNGLADKTPVFLINVNNPTDTISKTPCKGRCVHTKGNYHCRAIDF